MEEVSLATKVVLALSVIAIGYLCASAVRGVVRWLARLVRAVLPKPPPPRKPQKGLTDRELG